MEKNIVLIGMMGCGKTTVGRLLAGRLGLEAADTDALIEERAGCAIRDIFRDYGEGRFRDWEWLVSQELSGQSGLVIACGGGLPLQDEAMVFLKGSGPVFWLDRDPGQTYDGLDVSGRPLAQAGREEFVRLYRDRAPIYRRWADYIIPCGDGPQTAAERVSTIYREVSP